MSDPTYDVTDAFPKCPDCESATLEITQLRAKIKKLEAVAEAALDCLPDSDEDYDQVTLRLSFALAQLDDNNTVHIEPKK